MKKLYAFILLFLQVLTIGAQSRSTSLTIQVNSVEGDDLYGLPITLMQTDYQVSYGTLKLNAEGICNLKVYPGNHQLTVEHEGFNPVVYDFNIAADETTKTISVSLTEKTRNPFALTAKVNHDVFEGTNSVSLSWNREAPAFFDDFESYTPFAVAFGEWTGIDADLEAAAPLLGNYPNRGVMQYAQIINPLTVNPTWWYDYPILRPYDGKQYVGFTRTNSGNANDDWLISPTITVGTDNVLQFMGKAADQYPERFMVYVTEKTDNPSQADFVRMDKGNYETADYRGWQQYTYDLSAYEGRQIKFAIRYISHYNLYGSFMFMIDNVYVGQQQMDSRSAFQTSCSARRIPHHSPANPNERFNIWMDNQLAGTTDGYEYLLTDVKGGNHTIGVQATYIAANSETTTMQVNVPEGPYARVTFNVTANSILHADGQQLFVTSLSTSDTYELTIADGKAVLPSLPYGDYLIHIAEGAFDDYQKTVSVTGDANIDILLADHIMAPYNITATADETGQYLLRWNQELIFSDSFEDYDDFATGSFGEWTSIDADQMPVYPIALGSQSNIVSFPGSGTATNPTAIPPMVFNPWHTTPAMLPTDKAIAAPTGDKTIIFFSAQQTRNDKWLISPLINIHAGYQLSVKAKGYEAMYPESMEFCVSDGSKQPSDFTVLSTVNPVSAGLWSLYTTDLSHFAEQAIRLAVHYTSNDAFLAQIDDFTVGPEDGQGTITDYGNVVRFDILVDGKLIGQSTTSQYQLPRLDEGTHTIGIRAVYKNGQSETSEYTIVVTGIIAPQVTLQTASSGTYYNLQGQQVAKPVRGIFIVKNNGQSKKVTK